MGPGGFNGARSAIMMTMKGQEFAKASGQAVVNVFYVVDFAQAETYGGAFRNVSAVNVKAGLATVPEASKLVVFAPKGQIGTATLREPIAVGGAFGEFADTQSGGEKALNTAANVIGFLGGIGTNSSKKYTMTADPAAWRSGLSELIRHQCAIHRRHERSTLRPTEWITLLTASAATLAVTTDRSDRAPSTPSDEAPLWISPE
jgi:hypothetical protein